MRSGRRLRLAPLRCAPLLWALIFSALLAPPASAQSEASPDVEAIEFRGNASIDAGDLRGVMKIRGPAWWNPFRRHPYLGPDYLTLDLYRITELYRDRGFPLAVVSDAEVSQGDDGKVRITITIEEGPAYRVRDVDLRGVQPSLLSRARRRLRIHGGDLLRRSKIEETTRDLTSFYQEAGYLRARIVADQRLDGRQGAADGQNGGPQADLQPGGAHAEPSPGEPQADLVFTVAEGPLFRMRDARVDTTAGRLTRTREAVVRREVLLEPGDIFRTSKVLKTQDRIYETGVFRTVRVVAEPDTLGRPLADLRIVVHERVPGWYGFGAGYTSDDRVRLLAEWGNRNLDGAARRLQANADVAFSLDPTFRGRGLPLKSAEGKLSYIEPWIFGTKANSQTSLGHVYEKQNTFDQDITSLEEALKRSIGRFSSVSLGLTNKWVRTGDTLAVGTNYITRNASVGLEEDRRDNLLDPRRGSQANLLAEYAGGLLGGTTEFSRWSATGSWYLSLRGGKVLALRARGGYIIPVGSGGGGDSLNVARIPFEERFRIGGGTTVRGYAENSLGQSVGGEAIGGAAVLLGNVELRFPIAWLIGGALFLDAGNVWDDPRDIQLAQFARGLRDGQTDPRNVAFGAGAGLRFATPVGPFRIDYGLKIGERPSGEKPGELHLSLGQAF
ncbi:MAG: outer membrane protein assembly factor [Candidatus Eisenbacteria bacterium]